MGGEEQSHTIQSKQQCIEINCEEPREGPKHRWKILEAVDLVQGLNYRSTALSLPSQA